MAKPREIAPDPLAESEEEGSVKEEEGEASFEEGSESEPEPAKTHTSQTLEKPEPPTSKPHPEANTASSDDDESGSEYDSDARPGSIIRPVVSKPMKDPKKPGLKPNSSGPNSPAEPDSIAGAKRLAPEETVGDQRKDAKKPKKKPDKKSENSEENRNDFADDWEKFSLFQWLWSEEDEIEELVSEKNVRFACGSLGIEEWVMNNGMELIEDEKRVELEEKRRELKVKELELLARRSQLMAEQSKLILNRLK